MNLKQLKLAGFKSFVDPTIIPFPSQLVAVVGPNGCGKSNVIDAVRWVMGESSAKNLRGESMTDVIFNGSSNRKAVGQASVELVFDNSLGRLSGQYASYQEIVVKRVVTRDGDSNYFLNGSRCRRRDITDIFLGTGAGTRGYSIIGQGTISRIVEAKPEELRHFLEEAAGISKYKERRKETLLRITHTRDNLLRISDIREELDKQLQRLERQAKTAARYQTLIEEEKSCKAQILALKWRDLIQEEESTQEKLGQLLLTHEEHQAASANAYLHYTQLKEQIADKNNEYQLLQTSFYQLATELARLEENREQHKKEKQRLRSDQQQLQMDWQSAHDQLQHDIETLETCSFNLEQLDMRLNALRIDFASSEQVFTAKQKQQNEWQQQADELGKAFAKAVREVQVEQVRLQHVHQSTQETQVRLEKLLSDSQADTAEDLSAEVTHLRAMLSPLQNEEVMAESQFHQEQNQLFSAREQLTTVALNLRREHDQFQKLSVQKATLVAQLRSDNDYSSLIESWGNKARLIEKMVVEEHWQYACEVVLGNIVYALVLESMEEFWSSPLPAPMGSALFTTAIHPGTGKSEYPRLIEKISGCVPQCSVDLNKIIAAPSLETARQWLPFLAQDESMITPDGYWFSHSWLRIAKPKQKDNEGVLAKQQRLNGLEQAAVASELLINELKEQQDNLHLHIQQQEAKLDDLRQVRLDRQDRIRKCEAEILAKERQIEQLNLIQKRLIDERQELMERLEELNAQKMEVDERIQLAQRASVACEAEQKELNIEKSSLEQAFLTAKTQVEFCRSQVHQTELQRERAELLIKQLNDTIQREQGRQETISDRLEKIASRLVALETPDVNYDVLVNEKLVQHREMEESLTQFRIALSELNNEFDQTESKHKAGEQTCKNIQEHMQQVQLQLQTIKVRSDNVQESLHELGRDPGIILAELSLDLTWSQQEKVLQDIVEKISRLGAINLAAIEEYETESQRKHYLDEQYNDLTEALTTLEAAIEKMDKETRQRLQATFDEVNAAFQSLFPRLFGGGRALLELTCDNLLEAGVMVMAQPPGKRNSTIHLLSGGEKAMTAVALVFAIFQLNPSPFCMLDEVDAPLDDVNVGRFCALVKEMSQFVQFLFITHNKITMELADHLIGVTMREPGVSRVVAVDVEQALTMAE